MTESIGARLKRIRRAQKLTQVQLSALSGLHQQVISRYERGNPDGWDMSLRTATKLARALGVSLDVLAGTWEREPEQAEDTEEEEHAA